MAMEFVWGMTEKNWRNFKHDHELKNFRGDGSGHCDFSEDYDWYGNCCVGNLCAEILHTCDDSDETSWYSYANIFALGIDDGYGETNEGKIPYALLRNSFKVPIGCKTFESFKKEFEKRFTKMINEKEQYKKLANMPLGNWN